MPKAGAFEGSTVGEKVLTGVVAAGGIIVAGTIILDMYGLGHKADEIVDGISDRVHDKMHGWKDRLLSTLGVQQEQDAQVAQALAETQRIEVT